MSVLYNESSEDWFIGSSRHVTNSMLKNALGGWLMKVHKVTIQWNL